MSGYNYAWNYVTDGVGNYGLFPAGEFHGGKVSTDALGNVDITFPNTLKMSSCVTVQATNANYECLAVPHSGKTLSWEEVLSIPEGTSEADAVGLFGIPFPFYADGELQGSYLLVKGYRSAHQSSRQIGSYSPRVYGTYVTVNLSFYRLPYDTETTPVETRIDSGANVSAIVYASGLDDVDASETCLEFFFASQTPSNWDDYVHQVFVGISNRFEADGNKGCNYSLWMPNMRDSLYNFEYYFGKFNPLSHEYTPEYGDGGEPSGYGQNGEDPSHNFDSDDIDPSDLPTLSVLSSGFVNVYRVSSGLLQNLGQALFPEPVWGQAATSEIDALTKLSNYLGAILFNGKLMDYIIDCHIVPVQVPAGSNAYIRAGGRELENPNSGNKYSAPTVTTAYVKKSCGSLSIPEAFGNFLDYTVRCKLYLPFYGYVEIPAEYWNGGTISVEYAFNVLDGTFVAYVKGSAKHSKLNSLIGQYSGVAITHLPIRGQDYSQIVSGLISTGVGVAGAAVSGGTSMLAGGSLASGVNAVLSAKPNMINNGSSNSSSAMMMHKKPYLIIEYPAPQFSYSYPKEKGMPLNISDTLGKYGGMTVADNPVLDGIPCTEREKERIRAALKSGLIFR